MKKPIFRAFVSIPYGASQRSGEHWQFVFNAIVINGTPPADGSYEVEFLTAASEPTALMLKDNVTRLLESCDLMVAVIDKANRNVFWEIGYFECLRRPIVFISNVDDEERRDIPVLIAEALYLEIDFERLISSGADSKDRIFPAKLRAHIDLAVKAIVGIRAWHRQGTHETNEINRGIIPAEQPRSEEIFFGYCNQSHSTALLIKDFLSVTFPRIRIIDWKWDFRSSRTIIEEIEQTAKRVTAALFLVTGDDLLASDNADSIAAPRDNVIFEIGYFAARLGVEKTILIVEAQAKMPSDLGGIRVIPMESRGDTRTIETQLRVALSSALR